MQPDYPARSKYDAAVAANYASTRFAPRVDLRERRIVTRLAALCEPFETVLDAPCGTGRMTGLFPSRRVTALDLSPAMLDHVRGMEGIEEFLQGDIERLPFPDDHFDLVISVRFLHHLPDTQTLERCLTELARVARGHVLVSYFDTFALQNLRRRFKARRRERPSHRLSRPWKVVAGIARRAGLEPVARRCSAPAISEQWFVLFRKTAQKPGPT
ncbi:MAG: class I SAM-dependent methyltransferase [Planctomycetes bacterium]|nr:class I SAM-dependent methyltransferase [Planctomycetota bacterium]